jgi:type VI secretion system protein ImpC
MPSLDFELGFSARSARPRKQEDPLRILILGDFGGADSGAPRVPLGDRPIYAVDVDDLEGVLAKVAPRAKVAIAGHLVTIAFDTFEDFHPDRLYERLEIFDTLRDVRSRLADPAQFAAAVEEFGPTPAAPKAESPPTPEESDAATFTRLLGAEHNGEPTPAHETLRGFIADLIAPYVTPGPDPRQEEYIESVDLAVSELMRTILRAPSFRSLEAIWRSVAWLVGRLELSETMELCLLDVAKSELAEDLDRNSIDLRAARIYHRLIDEVPGGKAWSVLVGNYEFGSGDEDLHLLARMSAIASQVGAPFLGAASPEIAGCESFASQPDARDWQRVSDVEDRNWHALRRSQFAAWIGLAAPRFLLRLPYGPSPRGEEVERFAFEEPRSPGEHDAYLWGNPANAIALLLALAFQERCWSMEPGDALDIESLPAHTYERDGEVVLKPCAEAFLSERSASALLDRGLIPLMSYRNRDAVRVARIQSLALPPSALAGPWSKAP